MDGSTVFTRDST